MPPLLVAWIIDTLKGEEPSWIYRIMGDASTIEKASFLALLSLSIFALESAFQWGYQYGFLSLAQKVQHKIRVECYKSLQNKDYSYFENNRLGDNLIVVNDDVNQLERFLNTIFNEFLQLSVVILFSIVILFKTNIYLALFCLTPIPLIIIGSLLYQKKISPLYKNIREKVSALNNRLENNLSGIMVIKSFTTENFELKRVKIASKRYAEANMKTIKYQSIYVPLIRLCIACGFSGVLLIGAYWILQGKNNLTLGELVLFSMLVQRLLWPLTRLGAMLDDLERARASAERIFKIMKTKIKEKTEMINTINFKSNIKFKNVEFSYEENKKILNNISINIKSGETIGIAGSTGCGKSTFVKCLLGLYEIDKGKIEIGNYDISKISKNELRKNIGLVSQDIYLFYGSIKENISYGNNNAPLSEIRKVAKLAELDSFIMSLPNQYESIIGEKGIKLSGGQRQRLSIARCLLKSAPIIVFDEATSAVDTETEKYIQENISTFTKNKTAIIIAHRLSTLMNCHKIIVLNNGQISEEGDHNNLLKNNGIYKSLWESQYPPPKVIK